MKIRLRDMLLAAPLALLLAGCPNDDNGGGADAGADAAAGPDMAMPPPPPTLGAQIDRMGRPAISTATNHAFDADQAAKDMAKDRWNADSNASGWAATYAAEVGQSLAIYDALDTVCGNQLLADMSKNDPSRYALLASLLAADRLWVNTAGAACSTYLAVEANAAGILVNSDCGGRKLDYDVIDISYSVLAVGSVAGVQDGVAADADTKGTAFPYLASPH